MSVLEQSQTLVDRALVTLCVELPESLGLYNTANDQFSVSALKCVPMLEDVAAKSTKFAILRDWMRSYRAMEDQPLSSEISVDSLKQAVRRARRAKARAAEAAKEQTQPTLSGKSNGKQRRAQRKQASDDEDNDDGSDASSMSTTSSDSSSVDLDELDDDVQIVGVKPAKGKRKMKKTHKHKNTKTQGKNQNKKRGKTKNGSNLPSMQTVLSSDEDDDEPNELFDLEEADVYEVETILDKRPARDFGDEDMYLVKWVGYDDPTWEPAGNISKDTLEEYDGQPVRENEYVVEALLDRKTVRDKETHLKSYKYYVKWLGYDAENNTWEPADNIPHNLRRKFDQKFDARKRRRTE